MTVDSSKFRERSFLLCQNPNDVSLHRLQRLTPFTTGRRAQGLQETALQWERNGLWRRRRARLYGVYARQEYYSHQAGCFLNSSSSLPLAFGDFILC